MSFKPKILFVYDMPKEKAVIWMDGLWAALNVLEDDFEIEKFNLQTSDTDDFVSDYDFHLGWGGFNSRVDRALSPVKSIKKGLCIAGNAFPPEGATNYDVLFYETKWYRDQIKFHPNIVQAFGVNTDLYNTVDLPFPIVWDYLGVGAFALWKRWDRMKAKSGNRLVIGEYQRDNAAESSKIVIGLVSHGIMASDMVNSYDLAMLYHCSRTLYIPADTYGGGERAIWEARACGLQVEIEDDNPKLKELVAADVKDHIWYAAQLKKGILSCL